MSAAERDDGCDWYFGVPFPSKQKAAEAVTAERELKVGDRVRVVTHGKLPTGSYHNARVGDIFTLQSFSTPTIGMGFWRTNGPDFYPHEIELLQPTFATNTRVRLIRNTQRYAVGDTGTVTVSSDESVGVRMDDGRYWSFKPEDLVVVPSPWGAPYCAGRKVEHDYGAIREKVMGNFSKSLACLANDPATPCIVARVDNGRPRPSNYPHVHHTAADATKEAERLASVNPGKQFDVYQRVSGRVAEVEYKMKEVA